MQNVRLGKIVKNDYITVVALILAVGAPPFLALLSVASQLGFPVPRRFTVIRVDESWGIGLLGSTAVIGALLFCWRVSSVRRFLKRGAPAQGRIMRIRLWKDRGRIEFEYEYAGNKFRRGTAVHRSKEVQRLREGDPVEVIVDSAEPKRALIRSLYVGD